MSFRTTNYFVFITIHFHDLFSHSLKASGRGRLHYLLAGDEGLVDCARDALEDDGKGDSGTRRILYSLVSAQSRQSAPNLIQKRLSYDYVSLEEVKMKRNLQSLDFQRFFRQEESSLSSTIFLNMSETSLRLTRTFSIKI